MKTSEISSLSYTRREMCMHSRSNNYEISLNISCYTYRKILQEVHLPYFLNYNAHVQFTSFFYLEVVYARCMFGRGRILLNWAKSMRACVYITVVPNWPALFFLQPSLGMRVEVLCPMLTNQLFIRGPCTLQGLISHLLIKS